MARRRDAGLELTEGVARDDAVELRVAQGSHGRVIGADEKLHPEPFGQILRVAGLGLDDGGQRHRLLGPDGVPQNLIDRHRHYQSRGSTNTWMVPPQVSPTAKASSSE